MIDLIDSKHEIKLTYDSEKVKVYEIINYNDDDTYKSYEGENKVITISFENNQWVIRLIEGGMFGTSYDDPGRQEGIRITPMKIPVGNFKNEKDAIEAYLCSLKV